MSISTKQWKDARLPFGLWLRYSQASEEIQRQTEELFHKRFGLEPIDVLDPDTHNRRGTI